MHICRFQTSHSLALPWMDSALKAELTFCFSLALYSSHSHCPLTMPRNAAEVWWSDRVVGPSQTQPSSQRAPAPVSPQHCSQIQVILAADGVLRSGRLGDSG